MLPTQDQTLADLAAKYAAVPPPEGYTWTLGYTGDGQRLPERDSLIPMPINGISRSVARICVSAAYIAGLSLGSAMMYAAHVLGGYRVLSGLQTLTAVATMLAISLGGWIATMRFVPRRVPHQIFRDKPGGEQAPDGHP